MNVEMALSEDEWDVVTSAHLGAWWMRSVWALRLASPGREKERGSEGARLRCISCVFNEVSEMIWAPGNFKHPAPNREPHVGHGSSGSATCYASQGIRRLDVCGWWEGEKGGKRKNWWEIKVSCFMITGKGRPLAGSEMYCFFLRRLILLSENQSAIDQSGR